MVCRNDYSACGNWREDFGCLDRRKKTGREKNSQKGRAAENIACKFLEDNGCQIRDRNFRCRQGEIDIIIWDKTVLAFVEVKYRSDIRFGYPAEAVTEKKKRKIYYTAKYYRYQHHIGEEISCRFDVIEILGNKIRWIKNAFMI